MSRFRTILILACFAVLLSPAEVWAWGAATHVKLASDLLSQLSLLTPAVAALLSTYSRDYLFGNLAADVVIAKRLSRVKQFCHHWETGFAIYDDARSNRGRAFALGYLSHLAADTVSHNKFVPRQAMVTGSTVLFGHLYWEMRADSTVGPYYWNKLRLLLNEMFSEHRLILSNQLTDTFLPFAINWQLFYRTNRFASQHLLRQFMDRCYGLSRWPLSDQLIREYRAESLERMVDILCRQRQSTILNEDPNGNSALAQTRSQKRMLRRMARSGLIAPHILYEAAVSHAPTLDGHSVYSTS